MAKLPKKGQYWDPIWVNFNMVEVVDVDDDKVYYKYVDGDTVYSMNKKNFTYFFKKQTDLYKTPLWKVLNE